MAEPTTPPPWLRDGLRTAWTELRLYVTTTWSFTRHTYRFVDGWIMGSQPAMNPLAMLATGATIVAAMHQLAGAVVGIAHPDGLIDAMLSALGPYLHYVVLGLVCHLVVAPGGPRQVSPLSTIAVALYAGAGPAALSEAVGWLVLCAIWPIAPSQLALGIMLGASFTVFCFALSTALAGLHKTAGWRIALAYVIAFPLTGVVFGMLRPPGNYGLHWVVRLDGGALLGLGM